MIEKEDRIIELLESIKFAVRLGVFVFWLILIALVTMLSEGWGIVLLVLTIFSASAWGFIKT